ncbi:hypothetical protein GCM10011386_14570 [Parapedobacter defluvii]|uniref:Uncharacterized protein n=1 Tax=Parapedobacter defluvii TaxID=2045106 RepID=A0ABQ1LEE8_9SPHI|nr:DUF6528 family protein [Parapedobacter defluvii]GGC23692.1 hypothetical protein GCM10011386_14570 [Parapedobacter defluvii]
MNTYTGFVKLSFLWVIGCFACEAQQTDKKPDGIELFACGDDQVLMLAVDSSFQKVDTVWTWRASETVGLPGEYLSLLKTMDDCKPIENGNELLLTSSSGAALVLERSTKKALFYAKAANAHSIEALPGNRIAVALSIAPGGNRIALYDRSKPDEVLFSDSLYSGHGVAWVPEKNRLYALGYDELRAYALADWDTDAPKLVLAGKWALPDKDGHDLSRVSGSSLLLSTHGNVWLFDLDNETFGPFGPLEGMHDVKSVSYNEATQRLIYTKAEISWWTHHIYSGHPDGVVEVPQINMYKVRVP